MGELIRREGAANPASFSGERLTSAITGQVEVEHYHRYLLARELCRGRDVLDVAAGEGYGTALLAQVATTAIGIEIDQASVDAARQEFPRPNLRYEQGDARTLPLPDATIDVAVSFETLEHIAEHDQFLSELRRVLRPGGLLILSTPDRDIYSPLDQPPNPFHVLELTRPEFDALLHRHFAHTAIAAQRAFIGSLIAGTASAQPVLTFERRGDALIEASHHLARAPFLIAFASDAPLPALPDSIYVYRSDLDTDARARAQADDARNDAEQAAIHAEGRTAAMDARRLDAEARIDAALAQADHYTNRTREEIQAHEATAARLAEAERRLANPPGLTEADRHVAHLQHHLAHQSAALHHAQHRLAQIESSSVWRATGPLRTIAIRHPGPARLLARSAKLAWWTATFQLGRRYTLWRTRHLRLPAPLPAPTTLPTLPPPPIVIPSSPNPEISLIICTYGQVAFTLACLRSLANNAPSRRFELILIDDAYPGPEDLAPLAAVQGIRLVRNPANLGFLRSCNHAATLAEGRYLHVLNNDTELLPHSLDALADLLDAHPEAGLAGSKLIFPDGRLQEAGGILWSDASGWNYGRNNSPDAPEYNYVRQADYISGASIMVRATTWRQLGGFDEAFAPAYYEDTDLAFRIRAAGQTVLYQPRSVVIHHEGASHGTDTASGIKAHQLTNQALMLDRWRDTLTRDHFPNAQHVLRARDRARHRRTILVVDHYTPEPDRDAGSRTMLAVLECLVEAGWTVKFWPQNRLYSPQYTPPLEAQGIEVIDGRSPASLTEWIRDNGHDLDHLMISRPDVAADLLNTTMRNTDAVLSLYGHDLHFARLQRQAAALSDPALLQAATRMERMERRIWRNFDLCIYLSEEEAITVRAMEPGTRAVSVIPYSFPIAPARTTAPSSRTILFVAGFAHPPNVDAATFLVHDILPHIPNARLILAGSNPSPEVRALASDRVDVTGWLSDEALAALYCSSRVAIVPLRFGAGVKGKVVEALSHGLPLVTTSIGAQGIPGLPAIVPVQDDPGTLATALATLLTDDKAWLTQSQAQTAFATTHYSREAMRASIVTALTTAEPPPTP